jgi:hypothetical protein
VARWVELARADVQDAGAVGAMTRNIASAAER